MTGARSDAADGPKPGGIRPAQRIWLQDRGVPVFGVGIRELLIRVESTGSLRHAASDMGMAYSKAFNIVRRAEEHLGFALLERRTGGPHGGGSRVSAQGKWLVGSFGALLEEAGALLDGLYDKHLCDWPVGERNRPEDDTGRETREPAPRRRGPVRRPPG